jgi:hypothetical protein
MKKVSPSQPMSTSWLVKEVLQNLIMPLLEFKYILANWQECKAK